MDNLKIIELTDDEKQFVLDNWDQMGLLALTRKTFSNKVLTGRSSEAKAVQKFLAGRQVKQKDEVFLTDSQKDFVKSSVLVSAH